MKLLLLLSALLGAITGVNPVGARTPVAAERVADAAQVAVAITAARLIGHRPVATFDRLAPRRAAAAVRVLAVATIPAWTSRRRE